MAPSAVDSCLWSFASRGMPRMSEAEWERLVEGAKELARDGRGNVTLRCANGLVAKTFMLKRRLSSALLRPYASRFVDVTVELARREVPAPRCDGAWSRDAARLHVVTYPWMPGRDLRDALRTYDAGALVSRLGAFVGSLQARGVLFRTFHFANVLVLDDGRLGLLDVVDVRFGSQRPGAAARAANLRQLLRYPEDEAVLRAHAASFATQYVSKAQMTSSESRRLAGLLPDWLGTALREAD